MPHPVYKYHFRKDGLICFNLGCIEFIDIESNPKVNSQELHIRKSGECSCRIGIFFIIKKEWIEFEFERF